MTMFTERDRKGGEIMPSNNEIADTLRQLRGDTPREQVAAACGISLSALAMYETGARMPRDEVKLALAQYYGKSVGEIFFGQ